MIILKLVFASTLEKKRRKPMCQTGTRALLREANE